VREKGHSWLWDTGRKIVLGLLRHGLSGGLVSAMERLLECGLDRSIEIDSSDSGGRLGFVGMSFGGLGLEWLTVLARGFELGERFRDWVLVVGIGRGF